MGNLLSMINNIMRGISNLNKLPSLTRVDEVEDDDVDEGKGDRWETIWLMEVVFGEPETKWNIDIDISLCWLLFYYVCIIVC